MVTIRVGNVKRGDVGEYVGRSGYGKVGSPLGSPFIVGRDGQRGECAAKFKGWLERRIGLNDAPVMIELARLERIARETGSLTLLCWCSPASCHAEHIAAVLRERLAEG
jgi:Domain of unknown function (DUF4326)